MLIPAAVRRIASAQDGVLTREQALRHGMTESAIRHALGPGGRWQRVLDGVYASFTGELQTRHLVRAALLRAGREAVVTGFFACRAHKLRYVRPGPLVLLVPAGVQRSCSPVARIMRVATMPPARVIAGLPVTEPDRAVVDACRGATSLRDVRALLCESVQSGLTTPNRIADVLGAARWKGAGLIRTAIGDTVVGCRSAPECELRDLVLRSRLLAEPRWNQPLPGHAGTDLVPDACWAEARVVVEIDSSEWHRFGDAPERTERRRARNAALGWTVLPVSPRRLREEPEAVLAEIVAAVRHGLAAHAA